MIYRELLASEALDPDPVEFALERLCEIIKVGFATICSGMQPEDAQPIQPVDFEPDRERRQLARRRGTPAARDAVACSPNQMALLFEMHVG